MIKYPGGAIAFWSIVFILVATPLAYAKFVDGKIGVGLLAITLPLACTLIWLNVRQAKWLVVAYLGLSTLGAIVMMFTNGRTLELALVTALGAYTSFRFAVWDGASDSAPQAA